MAELTHGGTFSAPDPWLLDVEEADRTEYGFDPCGGWCCADEMDPDVDDSVADRFVGSHGLFDF